ncbi:hypothetical protein U1Q18_027982 [Sarracenia purpurea var. burkii]
MFENAEVVSVTEHGPDEAKISSLVCLGKYLENNSESINRNVDGATSEEDDVDRDKKDVVSSEETSVDEAAEGNTGSITNREGCAPQVFAPKRQPGGEETVVSGSASMVLQIDNMEGKPCRASKVFEGIPHPGFAEESENVRGKGDPADPVGHFEFGRSEEVNGATRNLLRPQLQANGDKVLDAKAALPKSWAHVAASRGLKQRTRLVICPKSDSTGTKWSSIESVEIASSRIRESISGGNNKGEDHGTVVGVKNSPEEADSNRAPKEKEIGFGSCSEEGHTSSGTEE